MDYAPLVQSGFQTSFSEKLPGSGITGNLRAEPGPARTFRNRRLSFIRSICILLAADGHPSDERDRKRQERSAPERREPIAVARMPTPPCTKEVREQPCCKRRQQQ